MTLTPIQRKFLAKYQTYRDRPITFSRQIASMIPRMIILAIFVAIAQIYVSTGLALFAGGMSLGAILRQGSLAWQATRITPGLIEVIDWEKVERLLHAKEPA